jgi:hypothetical protein
MANIITINSITLGTSPFDVWVCDECNGTCQYIDTFSATSIPYSFVLPEVYETYPNYIVKIIDDNGCVFCYELSSYKEFQDGDLFEFMGGDPYEFE